MKTIYEMAKKYHCSGVQFWLGMFDEELISWSVDGGGNFFYRSKHKYSLTNVSGYIRVLDKNINFYKALIL